MGDFGAQFWDYFPDGKSKEKIWEEHRVSHSDYEAMKLFFLPEWVYEEEEKIDIKYIRTVYFKATKEPLLHHVEHWNQMMYSPITMQERPTVTYHVTPEAIKYKKIIETALGVKQVESKKESSDIGW